MRNAADISVSDCPGTPNSHHCIHWLHFWGAKTGLFAANPTPLMKREPLLHTNQDARIQIGRQPNESATDDAANLSGRLCGRAQLYSKLCPPNS